MDKQPMFPEIPTEVLVEQVYIIEDRLEGDPSDKDSKVILNNCKEELKRRGVYM